MKRFQNLILIPWLLFSSAAIAPNFATAQELSQGYFVKAPRLLSAATTFSGIRVRGAKYYFNIVIPEDAGNNLRQLAIAKRQGQENIDFRLAKTVAYLGTNRKKGEPLAIANVAQNEQTREVIVTFAKSIPPGTEFTVGLKPRRNPDYAGVYLFGVTAIPEGNDPTPLYLGAGRLHFYSGGHSRH